MPRLRRLRPLLGLALLVSLAACDSDGLDEPGVERWAGSYTGQSRFGGANGTWGNGGTYPLVVSATGQVTVQGALVLEPTFDPATDVFTWTRAAGNATNGQITFRETSSDPFFFSGIGSGTVGQNFSGSIRIGNDGNLDYRGVLR
jgi:hypothetical protein